MNPVLTLTRNCLNLTKQCADSVLAQDIPVELFIFDNGSTDGTNEWLNDQIITERHLYSVSAESNYGVSRAWNIGLQYYFGKGYDHVLVINNDTILPHWFYRELLSYDKPFVTGVAVDSMKMIEKPAERMPLTPAPDFSAFLVKRSAWDAIGPFNEQMKLYASDCDYHVRGHRAGMEMWKANVPYFHQGSSTMRFATDAERSEIHRQANEDRAVFQSLYHCLPGQPEYAELFKVGS